MTAVSHALIGAAIAAKSGNPITVGTLSLFTHFVCDAIPHWDLGTSWRLRPKVVTGALAILETLFAVASVYIVFSRFVTSPTVLAVALVCSLLPDWLEVPYYLTLPNAPKPFYWIYKAQSYLHSKLEWPWGAVTQVVVVGAFLTAGFIL